MLKLSICVSLPLNESSSEKNTRRLTAPAVLVCPSLVTRSVAVTLVPLGPLVGVTLVKLDTRLAWPVIVIASSSAGSLTWSLSLLFSFVSATVSSASTQ